MQAIDFKIKKEPRQARSRETVRAIIQACAQILEEDGYAALNTNAIAALAGVSIGSIYEYFPSKEAIVATLVDELVEECFKNIETSFNENVKSEFNSLLRTRLELIYQFVRAKRKIFLALLFQTPFIYQVPSVQFLREELFRRAIEGNSEAEYLANRTIANEPDNEKRYLLISSSAGVVLNLALMPEEGVDPKKVLDDYAIKLKNWIIEG